MKVLACNSNRPLAEAICAYLNLPLTKASVRRFADMEVFVEILENVRGEDVFVVQSTSYPANDNLMELLVTLDALRRGSARRVTAVIPYYGYARQDRKMQARTPISAANVARLLESMGVDRVIAVDLHCGQIQGFFGPRVPVDNLDGGMVGVSYFGDKDLHNPVVVSPDAGGVYRAKKFREGLASKFEIDASLAMIVKQRSKPNEVSHASRSSCGERYSSCCASLCGTTKPSSPRRFSSARSMARRGAHCALSETSSKLWKGTCWFMSRG